MSARPKVRLVQVETSEMLTDCLTKIQSTPNSAHLSRLGPVLNTLELCRKDRAEEECRNFTLPPHSHVFFFLLSSPFSVARITRSTMHSELILSTQLHILTDKFFVTCRIMNLDVVSCGGGRLTVFCVVLFGESQGNSSHVWRSSKLHPRNNTSTSLSFRSLTARAQFCRWRTRSQIA